MERLRRFTKQTQYYSARFKATTTIISRQQLNVAMLRLCDMLSSIRRW